MAKARHPQNILKLAMTLSILAALPISVFAFNSFRYGRSQASSSPPPMSIPGGPHYNLNLIGVPKGKIADMVSNQGRRIFVPLTGKTQILLSAGTFAVLDANGTDGQASFSLPNPDIDKDGVTDYSVWVRALGKPGGKSSLTACADDPATNETYCSVYQLLAVRNKGTSSFSDVSRDLLYVYTDLNGDGTSERYPLFDNALQDYFWEFDNQGMKILQLRFYEMPSSVTSAN